MTKKEENLARQISQAKDKIQRLMETNRQLLLKRESIAKSIQANQEKIQKIEFFLKQNSKANDQ